MTSTAPILVSFDVKAPSTLLTAVPIAALGAGQQLVGLEVRPLTGQLYALGYNPTARLAQLYTLSPSTGVLTATNISLTLNLGANLTSVGFTFNPVTDQVRVTGANGANYTFSPSNPTQFTPDNNLVYAPTDTNAGQTPGVGSLVYTPTYVGSTSTTLYGLDEANNRLVSLPSPSTGALSTVATLVNFSTNAPGQVCDLDMYYDATTATNVAYLSALVPVGITPMPVTSYLYRLNLTTGVVTPVGPIGISSTNVADIALAASTSVVTAARPAELGTAFTLFPNPAANSLNLHFDLPRATQVELLVTDALGRSIDALAVGSLPAGPHTVSWSRGNQAAGLYCFRLCCNGQIIGTCRATLTQ